MTAEISGPRRLLSTRILDPALVVAAIIAVAALLPVLDDADAPRRPLALAVTLIAIAGGATLIRSWHPEAAALIAAGATGAYLTLSFPYGPVFIFIVLPVYTLARRRPLRRAVPVAVAVLLLLWVHLLTNEAAAPGALGLLPATAWVAVPFTIGSSRRTVVASGERERSALAQQATDAERLRLAQEVHDVVGHGLAAIQMQADVALHVEKQRPEQARAALVAISAASGAALDELRETLRRTHPYGHRSDAPKAPLPGLARIEDLRAHVATAGVEVDLKETGTPLPLPAASDVAAYRLLQEALTNVIKHSAHPQAQVAIHHGRDAVTVEVVNQDLGTSRPAPGIGMIGMRRRIAAVGGSFAAGADAAAHVFCVRATIPRRPQEPR